jgi:hypothetical protein
LFENNESRLKMVKFKEKEEEENEEEKIKTSFPVNQYRD